MEEASHQALGTNLDYAIIIAYFLGIVAFGSYFGRYTKSTRDFFFGGQKFAWWLIAFSLVSTTVGSYSFIKYSRVAFTNGLSSTMSYTNDWFWMPFFMLAWMPIIYFSRVTSVPEYFERRFDRRVRTLVTIAMLVYLTGYVGINFYTLGIALNAMLGWDIFYAACAVAVVSAIYVTAGGQASVIMTDLIQGGLLLFAGFLLFGLGLHALGGLNGFWEHLPYSHRLPLNYFNSPPNFNFAGVLWQDGVSQSMFAYFINQGMMMRFLAAKSPREGQKAAIFLLLVLQLLAAVAVSNAGWLGRAMVGAGLLPEDIDPGAVFVIVAHELARPGVFGFIMAALTAALMSTADTLINATSAVVVNDIWKLHVRPNESDAHYLKVARIVTVCTVVFGVMMVPVFQQFGSIYAAHGAFTAAVTPPVAVTAFCAAFWRGFGARAAAITLLGGAGLMAFSMFEPWVITPFSLGVEPGGEGWKAWKFQRAMYGVMTSGAIALVAGKLTQGPTLESISGLVWGTLDAAKTRFKGSPPNEAEGERLRLAVQVLPETTKEERVVVGDELDAFHILRKPIRLSAQDKQRLAANEGDLVYIADTHWFYGGLRAAHALVGPGEAEPGTVGVPSDLLEEGSLTNRSPLYVEKIL